MRVIRLAIYLCRPMWKPRVKVSRGSQSIEWLWFEVESYPY